MAELIKKIFYFREGLDSDNFFELIYNMKGKIYDQGHIIFKKYDEANKIYFVIYGVVEVYT